MFNGSLVALVTPFDSDNRVDYDALKRLVDFHADSGTAGLVVAGTTGESATLETDEHIELLARAVELSAGRLPIIAGTGSNSTAQTIGLSTAVDSSGIDAFLIVVPYYNKPTQEGLFRHFSAVADAVTKPVMLYNVPGRTVADLLPETVARLAEHSNIFGIKEATGDIERLKQIRALASADFRYYSGDDFTTLPFIEAGGHGVVSVTGNVAPRQVADLCSLAAAGDAAAAKALDDRLQGLNEAMFLESNPIPVKWALSKMGLIGPGIRLPLTELDDQYHDDVRRALSAAGIDTQET